VQIKEPISYLDPSKVAFLIREFSWTNHILTGLLSRFNRDWNRIGRKSAWVWVFV